jgi:glycosyltransferase involved in cell wall biosynthesis
MSDKVYFFNRKEDAAFLVTIGLCVRNEQAMIDKTIRSIFDQDFPHELMELIVVDDGSEDATLPTVLSLVSNSDICTAVFSTKWRGIGSARNKVLDNAKGKYIVWIDGGMTISKDYIRKLVKFMERNKNVGIAKGKCKTFDGKTIVSILESLQFLAVDFRYDKNVKNFVIGTGGAIYRVEALKEIGGFDKNLAKSGEDLDVEYKMRDKGWLIYRVSSAVFGKKHPEKLTSAWHDNIKYGYGGHYLINKYSGEILARFKNVLVHGLLNAKMAYQLTYRKEAFLLPFYYSFMKIAWLIGYLKVRLAKSSSFR